MPVVLKVLSPHLATEEFIKILLTTNIEKNTDTAIVVSGREQYFPTYKPCRVVSIAGSQLSMLLKVFDVIQNIIEDCGGHKKADVYCVIVVTDYGAGNILGERGSRINELLKEFGDVIDVKIENRKTMDPVIKERYIEIACRSKRQRIAARDAAKRIIEISSRLGARDQPFHSLKYPVCGDQMCRPPRQPHTQTNRMNGGLSRVSPPRSTLPPLSPISVRNSSGESTGSEDRGGLYIEGNSVMSWERGKLVRHKSYDVFRIEERINGDVVFKKVT